NGDALITGSFEGSVDFGGGPLSSVGLADIYVAKFSGANGSHVWSRRGGGASTDGAYGIAVDTAGNAVIAGYFFGSSDFGTGSLTSAGGYDVFLAKYAGTGTPLWSVRYGGTSTEIPRAIAVDTAGDVVVSGYFAGVTNLGSGSLTSAGSNDIFLAKYS